MLATIHGWPRISHSSAARVEVQQLGRGPPARGAEHVGERGHRDLVHEPGGGRRVGADGRRAERDDVGRVGQRDVGAVEPGAQRVGLHAPVAERAAMARVAQHEPLAERQLERPPPVGQILAARREDVLERELGQQLGDQLAVDVLPALPRQRVDERGGHAAHAPGRRRAPAGAPKD